MEVLTEIPLARTVPTTATDVWDYHDLLHQVTDAILPNLDTTPA